jgi:hypothetical protein
MEADVNLSLRKKTPPYISEGFSLFTRGVPKIFLEKGR